MIFSLFFGGVEGFMVLPPLHTHTKKQVISVSWMNQYRYQRYTLKTTIKRVGFNIEIGNTRLYISFVLRNGHDQRSLSMSGLRLASRGNTQSSRHFHTFAIMDDLCRGPRRRGGAAGEGLPALGSSLGNRLRIKETLKDNMGKSVENKSEKENSSVVLS